MEITIEERAYEAVGKPLPKEGEMYVPHMLKVEESTFVNGYIKGAKEQRDIDIEKACAWLKGELCKLAMDKIEEDFLQNDFRVILKEDVPKWIDELCKAMEG